ncbi:MAG: hypothetical protein NZM38_11070 [Cytophagales bacterium]|nr:hypothetical protein [Cytophagales bacterium]MDW8385296.1 hypothetical protein [Flammeovirgaceae bacterium]
MLNFIKNLFLRLRKNQAIKQNQVVRQNISFKSAKNIGVIFSLDDIQNPDTFSKFIKSLKTNGRNLQIIGYSKQPTISGLQFQPKVFGYKDVSLWGEIRNEELNNFIRTPFDYLFCLSKKPLPFFDYILANSPAKCRICQYADGRHLVAEMIIKPKPNAPEEKLYERFLYYTQLL